MSLFTPSRKRSQRFGSYTLQAAIAAVHDAESPAPTDWRRIVALRRVTSNSPFARGRLNRAVAVAMRDGPEAGLTHIDALLSQGELANYYPGAFSPCRHVPQAGQDI
jgi:RNA polymerase sigma-70 factor, ECF subfamily